MRRKFSYVFYIKTCVCVCAYVGIKPAVPTGIIINMMFGFVIARTPKYMLKKFISMKYKNIHANTYKR